MRVRVLYFGLLKDVLGTERELMELTEGSLVSDLLGGIRARDQRLTDLWKSIAVAVNQEYVPVTAVLSDGDEVALLPPVSGGKGKSRTYAG